MKKYKLARKLYAKYHKLALERYAEFGCEDRTYRMYSRLSNLCSNILHRNGWTSWI